MSRRLMVEPISDAAFAPFGQVLPPPVAGGPRRELLGELQNQRPGAVPRLSLAAIRSKPLPLTAIEMERHQHSSQAFLPVDCAAYLVIVAPHGPDGGPDPAGLRAFRVPGDTGINYHADTWHHPLTVLERDARFTVFMFVDGTEADEQFVPLPEPVVVEG